MNRDVSAFRDWLVRVTLATPMGVALYRWRNFVDGSKATRIVLKQLAKQSIIDQQLRTELNSDAHSFEEPLAILDPYGDSPLTAVVVFTTERPKRISVSLQGVDGTGGVEFSFDDHRMKHLIPIYGLLPDADNLVTLRATDENGESCTRLVHIRTEKLPANLQNVRVDVLQAKVGSCQPGLTFLYKNRPKFAFDADGRIRWFLNLPTNMATLYNFNGHVVTSSGVYLGRSLLYEIDLLGRFYWMGETPYGAHHEIKEIAGAKLLVTGSRAGPTIKDLLYEFDPTTGGISNVMDFKRILDPARPTRNKSNRDWMHLNAIVWSESDNSIIVSARNQSAVLKLSYPEGRIKWILANHDGWLPEYVKYLLTPKGNHFEWQHSQHSPIILSEQHDHPGIVDIILFDNHSFMKRQTLEARSDERFSRVVQYRIDEEAKTVEQIWEFGRERGSDLFTHHCGQVDSLANSDLLMYFNLGIGHRADYSRIMEIQRGSGQVMFDAVVYSTAHHSLGDYRCARRELYSASDNDLWRLEPCRENIAQSVARRANES